MPWLSLCGINMSAEKAEQKPDPLKERKKLSFEQAEGLVEMPRQLARGEISGEFRAVLWDLMRRELRAATDQFTGAPKIPEPWSVILSEAHVYRDHRFDDFPRNYNEAIKAVKARIESGKCVGRTWLGRMDFQTPSLPVQFSEIS